MNPSDHKPPSKLARATALLLSMGVVTFVTARAAQRGCVSTPDITADSPSAADTAPRPGTYPASSSRNKDDWDDARFMGGAKAPAGGWAFPPAAPTSTASASGAPPQKPNQAPAKSPP